MKRTIPFIIAIVLALSSFAFGGYYGGMGHCGMGGGMYYNMGWPTSYYGTNRAYYPTTYEGRIPPRYGSERSYNPRSLEQHNAYHSDFNER